MSNCKTWGGPCTSVDELHTVLKDRPNEQEHIIKTEHSYYAHTHKADKIARPALYKINGITHEEKLLNLSILLDDDTASQYTVADLPTNADVISTLQDKPSPEQQPMPNRSFKFNELCVVVWQNCDAKYEWFVAYVKEVNADKYVVDHLHRATAGSDCKWKYPRIEDIQEAEIEQIVICDVEGHWDITPDKRKRLFTVKNINEINHAFQKHINF